MRVVGYIRKIMDFNDRNTGKPVHCEGFDIHLSRPITSNGDGYYTECVFVSDAKLSGYMPAVNDDVEVLYNKYRKVQAIRLIK